MTAAIRQRVTVQAGGVIEIRSPDLRPGSSAEVIVLVDSPQPTAQGGPRSGDAALRALDALQEHLALTPSAAAAWAKQALQERRSASRRREQPAKPPKRR